MIVGYSRKFGSGGGNDSYTKLLLHCDGSDGSTTITDSSASAHTISASGNAQIDTAQSKFGGASCLFDGTTDYLVSSDHADWDYAGANFTIDTWARLNGFITNGTMAILCQGPGSPNQIQFGIKDVGGATYHLQFLAIIGGTIVGDFRAATSPNLTTGTWYHLAVERSGSTVNFYQNGTKLTTSINTNWGTISDIAFSLTIGADNAGTSALNGWIDELRLSKGVARYGGSSFSTPTGPYS